MSFALAPDSICIKFRSALRGHTNAFLAVSSGAAVLIPVKFCDYNSITLFAI